MSSGPAAGLHRAERVRLQWPPPGLEPVHDSVWPLVRAFTIGGLVLVLPLLAAIALDAPFWSLGTFGAAWWIPVVTTLIGFGLLLSASVRLRRLLRAGSRAAALGHGGWLILAAAADRTRDNGFVLQGARRYAALTEQDRHRLLVTRAVAPCLHLAAALWLPLGFTAGALLGYLQLLPAAALWPITLGPSTIGWLAGVLVQALAGTLAAPARVPEASAAVQTELQHEADAWTANLALLSGDDRWTAGRASPRALRVASAVVVLPTLLLLLLVAAVAASAALGPLLASLAVPVPGTIASRHAQLALLRPYRLPADPTVTPAEAGTALHNLVMTGMPEPGPLLRPPARTYTEPWPAVGPNAVAPLGDPVRWPTELFDRVAAGLTAGQREYLAAVAGHPAHAEFRILAAAAGADVPGARYVSPLPDDVSTAALPIPRLGNLRFAAYSHIGRAADQLERGDARAAEETVREVLSAGLLIADESTMLIDALIGGAVARAGGEALIGLYRVTGRTTEAERLAAALQAGSEVAEALRPDTRPDLSDGLRAMTRTVLDEDAPRALRWEYLAMFSTISPCLNLHQTVLGPGADHAEWLAAAEQSLVRYTGERELFELVRSGMMSPRGPAERRCGLPPGLLGEIRNR